MSARRYADDTPPHYYFVKLGSANRLAAPLLRDACLGMPHVLCAFQNASQARIEEHLAGKRSRENQQAVAMYRWSRSTGGYAVTVALGNLWVLLPLEPSYEIDQLPDCIERDALGGPFCHAVSVAVGAAMPTNSVPAVLTGLMGHRSYISTQFKLIEQDSGVLLALDHVLFRAGLVSEYPTEQRADKSLAGLLSCLTHQQLVALVARIAEDYGLRAGASTGGFVRDIDLVLYNDSADPIDAAGLTVPARTKFRSGAVSLGVSHVPDQEQLAEGVDYRVEGQRLRDRGTERADWLASALVAAPRAWDWLERTLRWVPFARQVLLQTRR